MCDPVSIAIGASTVVGAGSAIQQGNTAERMGDYNAKVAETKGAYEADRLASMQQRLRGSQRVAAGAAGIDISGSPLEVMADSAAEAELDRLAVLRGAASQAAMDRAVGRQQKTASRLSAVSTLLAGGISAAKWGVSTGKFTL